MQKWGYCYISGIKAGLHFETSYPRIVSFDSTEPHVKVEELRKKPDHEEVFVVADAIARLGEEGWEMVSVAAHGDYGNVTLFFKRPLP